jgi:hypothetical protein
VTYADDVNLLEDNINTVRKNTEISTDDSKGVDLKINAENTKYMLVSNQNLGQNQGTILANRSSENVSLFKYLRMTVINQNLIHEEIKEIEFW